MEFNALHAPFGCTADMWDEAEKEGAEQGGDPTYEEDGFIGYVQLQGGGEEDALPSKEEVPEDEGEGVE